MADYYEGNPLAALRELRQRVEVLERLLATAVTPLEAASAEATPEVELPAARDIPPLYVIEEGSGDIYRLVCRWPFARTPQLFLWRVGRSRGVDAQ